MPAARGPESVSAADTGDPWQWAIMTALGTVAFMAQLDLFIVDVALDGIGKSFATIAVGTRLLARAVEYDSPTLPFRPAIRNTGPNSPLISLGTAGLPRQVAPTAATRERRTARFLQASRWEHLERLVDQATLSEEKLWTKWSRLGVTIVVPQFAKPTRLADNGA